MAAPESGETAAYRAPLRGSPARTERRPTSGRRCAGPAASCTTASIGTTTGVARGEIRSPLLSGGARRRSGPASCSSALPIRLGDRGS